MGDGLQSVIKPKFRELQSSHVTFHLASKEILVKDKICRAVDLNFSVGCIVTKAVSSYANATKAFEYIITILACCASIDNLNDINPMY
jgi:hypothetical protein